MFTLTFFEHLNKLLRKKKRKKSNDLLSSLKNKENLRNLLLFLFFFCDKLLSKTETCGKESVRHIISRSKVFIFIIYLDYF